MHGDAGAALAFGIGGGALWLNDVGYDAVADQQTFRRLELSVAHDLLQPVRPVVVAAELAYDWSDDEGGGDRVADAALRQDGLLLSAMVRYTPTSWLWPHLRLGVGTAHTRLSLQEAESNLDYTGHDWGLAAVLGAGISLRTPTRLFETRGGKLSSLSVGVRFEGGYRYAQAADLTVEDTAEDGDIAVAPVQLGSLDRSGAYVRIQAVLRL